MNVAMCWVTLLTFIRKVPVFIAAYETGYCDFCFMIFFGYSKFQNSKVKFFSMLNLSRYEDAFLFMTRHPWCA